MKNTNLMENETLTPDEVLTGKKKDKESSSLPSVIPSSYIDQDLSEKLVVDDQNFIEKILDAYQNARIKPIVKREELGGSDMYFDDGSGKKSAFFIGLDFSF